MVGNHKQSYNFHLLASFIFLNIKELEWETKGIQINSQEALYDNKAPEETSNLT